MLLKNISTRKNQCQLLQIIIWKSRLIASHQTFLDIKKSKITLYPQRTKARCLSNSINKIEQWIRNDFNMCWVRNSKKRISKSADSMSFASRKLIKRKRFSLTPWIHKPIKFNLSKLQKFLRFPIFNSQLQITPTFSPATS